MDSGGLMHGMLVALAMASAPAAASAGTWRLSTGADYTNGDYGGDDDVSTLYAPVNIKYRGERVGLRLTVPYLEVSGPGTVLDEGGQLFERIERSIANEKRFTADAAHELRNPVAAIRAQAEASLGAEDPSDVRAGLSRISTSAARLSRLVEQLLALARLDAATDRISFTTVDLVDVSKQTLAELAPGAIGRGAMIDLEAPESAILLGDAALLAVVIRNLVENALIHGGPGVQITTRIARTDSAYELTVEDNGPGVAVEQRGNLGRRFFRDETSEAEGSGLGLSLVERIAELHGAATTYGAGPSHRGLRVSLRFPQQAHPHDREAK